MMISNQDADSRSYEKIKDIFRPGHADYTYFVKYGIRDYRGGGRSSGRETVARVAAGALAKKILKSIGVEIQAYTKAIGDVQISKVDLEQVYKNPVRCPDVRCSGAMQDVILKAKSENSSIGGVVEVVASNVPAGLGEPVFDKLDADIAKALMSIGGVKAVEIGDGFAYGTMLGGMASNDAFYLRKRYN